MGMSTTTFEMVERPLGWRGENVDMRSYDGELDEFELEVDADVDFGSAGDYWSEPYGAEVTDLHFTLHGDFRPWHFKLKAWYCGVRGLAVPSIPLAFSAIDVPEEYFDAVEIEEFESNIALYAEENRGVDPDADPYFVEFT